MITDTLQNASSYYPLSQGIAKALRFLQSERIDALPLGNTAIDGERIFAIVQEYPTKLRAECFWEAHRRFIDVQFIASGIEAMGWAPIQKLRVIEAYDPKKERAVFDGEGHTITVAAGEFAIFYPHDGHMPCLAVQKPAPVRKIVVKVAVE